MALTVTHFVQEIIYFISGIRFEGYHLPMDNSMKTIETHCKKLWPPFWGHVPNFERIDLSRQVSD